MKLYSILLYSILFCVFTSCSVPKYLYTPATPNLLQVDERNELKIAANYSNNGKLLTYHDETNTSDGIDIQSIYSISNKIAVKVDGYSKWEKTKTISNINGISDQKIIQKKMGAEISLGLFNVLQTQKNTTLQLYGGFGVGKFSLDDYRGNNDIFFHNTEYVKYFLQPVITGKVTKNYFVSFCTKLNIVKYQNTKTNYTNLLIEPLGYIETKPSFFIDYALQNEFRFNKNKWLTLQLQTGYSQLFTRFSANDNNGFKNEKYDYNNIWFAIGGVINISNLKSAK